MPLRAAGVKVYWATKLARTCAREVNLCKGLPIALLEALIAVGGASSQIVTR